MNTFKYLLDTWSQYTSAGGVTNNRLLNTLTSAVGVPTTNFGQGTPGVIDGMLASG